jgi:hypothetical protein
MKPPALLVLDSPGLQGFSMFEKRQVQVVVIGLEDVHDS